MVKMLALRDITRDETVQQRAGGVRVARVREYAKAMRVGDQFPPIVVYHDGDKYWLADGFHRCEAAERISRPQIETEIRQGGRRDAVLFATGANAQHGVRRTNEDKRKAVSTLLLDGEWEEWSDHEIARRTHCTQPFVSKMRKELSGENSMPVRKGTDGRLMNVSRIGKRKIVQAWNKASNEEKLQWAKEYRDEIQMLLKYTDGDGE